MSTVVFLHAHPDDEAIFTGGTMALLAERHRVVLLVATSGELGTGPTGRRLAEARRAETRHAAELLGIHRVEFLPFRDSGLLGDPANSDPRCLHQADPETAARLVAEVCTEEATEALVVYDAHGIYGHPDHVAVHRIGHRAAVTAGVGTVYESTVDREYLHFVETHVVEGAAATPTTVGLPSVEITTMVPVGRVIDTKRRAIAAHGSQVPSDSHLLQLPDAQFREVYGLEWYVRRGPAGPICALAH